MKKSSTLALKYHIKIQVTLFQRISTQNKNIRNFYVSFTKYIDQIFLRKTNNYVSKNANRKVKFCFADSHGNLKIKFSDNKNVSYDTLQLFLEALDKKLHNKEIGEQFNHDRECEGDE